jgi:hypothetical protein
MPDNNPTTIKKTISEIIANERWRCTATVEVQKYYGMAAVSRAMEFLMFNVRDRHIQS